MSIFSMGFQERSVGREPPAFGWGMVWGLDVDEWEELVFQPSISPGASQILLTLDLAPDWEGIRISEVLGHRQDYFVSKDSTIAVDSSASTFPRSIRPIARELPLQTAKNRTELQATLEGFGKHGMAIFDVLFVLFCLALCCYLFLFLNSLSGLCLSAHDGACC